jgi:hypothetical protein
MLVSGGFCRSLKEADIGSQRHSMIAIIYFIRRDAILIEEFCRRNPCEF